MHHISKFREIEDDLTMMEACLATAYLANIITLEQAVIASHSYKEYFLEHVEMIKKLALMQVENEEEVNAILRGAE